VKPSEKPLRRAGIDIRPGLSGIDALEEKGVVARQAGTEE
jgi:hypothetical protein